MNKSILKTIFGGIFLGTLLFFAPFFLLVFFVGMIIMKFLFFRRFKGNFKSKYLAYAEKVRAMSDEEFENFKTNFSHNCHPKHKIVAE